MRKRTTMTMTMMEPAAALAIVGHQLRRSGRSQDRELARLALVVVVVAPAGR